MTDADPDMDNVEFWTSLGYSIRPWLKRFERKEGAREVGRRRNIGHKGRRKGKNLDVGFTWHTVGLLITRGKNLAQA